jgi:hypothetical protein
MKVARIVGAVGALVFLVGFFLLSAIPGGGETDAADFQEFYVEDEDTVIGIVAMYLLTLGVLGMLWWLRAMRDLLVAASARYAFGAAVGGFALVLAGAAVMIGPSGVQQFGDGEFVGENVAHAMAQAGWAAILVGGALSLGAALAGFALAGRETRAMASWLWIAGIVAAVLQLAAVVWVPSLAVPLWIGLSAIVGVRVGTRATADERPLEPTAT